MLNSFQTCSSLNRLSVALNRSLSGYLQYAPPWMNRDVEDVTLVLKQIVSDQEATVDRIGTMIQAAGEDVDPGEFPIEFASLHDLSLDYLLTRMVDGQREIVSVCEQAVSELAADALAQAVAQEAVGTAKAHLDSLLELFGNE
ncbi:MAG: hypothetical protein VB817_07660 [Pirellulaceae bacterium]